MSSLKTQFMLVCAAFAMIFASGCASFNTAPVGYQGKWSDVKVVACVGDSLTTGYMSVGAPYPERLAALTGKTVHNYSKNGVKSEHGVLIITAVVTEHKPAFVCILYGTNDVITHGDYDQSKVINNLRQIIRVCHANECIPLIATIPPIHKHRGVFNDRAAQLSAAIRVLAIKERARVVDLNKAFGNGKKHLNPDDGLHFSDAGGNLVAKMFSGQMP